VGDLDSATLLRLPDSTSTDRVEVARHPEAAAQQAAIEEVKARQTALARSYYPRFHLQAAMYGRGTGVQPDGSTGGAASGLGPNVQNWGMGMTVTFPAFDIAALRARREIEAHRERAESARYDRVVQDLASQIEQAKARLAGARRVAENTPVQLEAARAAEQQASARYRAELGTIVEVAEAQRLLTQAEIDDALARLNVWRALLGVAVAQGDLGPYFQIIR
jgi:outer membrane protein TolC